MRSVLALFLPVVLFAQSALLQIRALDAEGAVYATGSRTQGFAVEVTDELGRPVPGAVVAVRLPSDGAGGSFATGLSSEILTTGANGRAVTSPIRWSWVPGGVEIRITAVKGTLRAGTVATCALSERVAARNGAAAPQPGPAVRRKVPLKWIVIGIVAAGAAGLGFATGRASGDSPTPSNPPGSIQIGSPVISVGQP